MATITTLPFNQAMIDQINSMNNKANPEAGVNQAPQVALDNAKAKSGAASRSSVREAEAVHDNLTSQLKELGISDEQLKLAHSRSGEKVVQLIQAIDSAIEEKLKQNGYQSHILDVSIGTLAVRGMIYNASTRDPYSQVALADMKIALNRLNSVNNLQVQAADATAGSISGELNTFKFEEHAQDSKIYDESTIDPAILKYAKEFRFLIHREGAAPQDPAAPSSEKGAAPLSRDDLRKDAKEAKANNVQKPAVKIVEPVATEANINAALSFDAYLSKYLNDPASLGKLIHQTQNSELTGRAQLQEGKAKEMSDFLKAVESLDMQYLVRYPSIVKMLEEGKFAQIKAAAQNVQKSFSDYKNLAESQDKNFEVKVLDQFTDSSYSRIKRVQDKAVSDAQKGSEAELSAERIAEIKNEAMFGTFRVVYDNGTESQSDDIVTTAAEAKKIILEANALNEKAKALGNLDRSEAAMKLRADAEKYGKIASGLSLQLSGIEARYNEELNKFLSENSQQNDNAASAYFDSLDSMHAAMQGTTAAFRAGLEQDSKVFSSAKNAINGERISEQEARFNDLASTQKFKDLNVRFEAALEKFSPIFGKGIEDPAVAAIMQKAFNDKHTIKIVKNKEALEALDPELRAYAITEEQLKKIPQQQKAFIMLIQEAYDQVEIPFYNKRGDRMKLDQQGNPFQSRASNYAAAVEISTKKGEEPNYDTDQLSGRGYRTKTILGETAKRGDYGPQVLEAYISKLENLSLEEAQDRDGIKIVSDVAKDVRRERELTVSNEIFKNFVDRQTDYNFNFEGALKLTENVLYGMATSFLIGSVTGWASRQIGWGKTKVVPNPGGGGSSNGGGGIGTLPGSGGSSF